MPVVPDEDPAALFTEAPVPIEPDILPFTRAEPSLFMLPLVPYVSVPVVPLTDPLVFTEPDTFPLTPEESLVLPLTEPLVPIEPDTFPFTPFVPVTFEVLPFVVIPSVVEPVLPLTEPDTFPLTPEEFRMLPLALFPSVAEPVVPVTEPLDPIEPDMLVFDALKLVVGMLILFAEATLITSWLFLV